jgi:hypothetical protein
MRLLPGSARRAKAHKCNIAVALDDVVKLADERGGFVVVKVHGPRYRVAIARGLRRRWGVSALRVRNFSPDLAGNRSASDRARPLLVEALVGYLR